MRLVLPVGQRHRRRDRDRVAGVHAHRVDVLDRADHDDVVVAVAHQLELELLPAEHALLDQHLVHRAGGQPGGGHPAQPLRVAGQAGAGAAHRERRPEHHRQAQLVRGLEHLVQRPADPAARHVAADRADDLLEPLPVLAAADRLDVGADELDAVPVQHAGLGQLDGGVQRGLPAQRGQHRVRPLPGDHLGDELRRDRLDVGRVGELRVGHDRGRVGVDQADPQPLGLEHPAGLGAGVVELARLADDDRPGADHQHVRDVVTPGHGSPPPTSPPRTGRTGTRRRAGRPPPRGGTAR